MKLNRNLVLCLALVLSLAMATTGTLAYLQDSDKDVNVMTLGNVNIVQNEQQRDENGNLVPFVDQPMLPAVYNGYKVTDTYWSPSEYGETMTYNDKIYKMFGGETIKNVVDKIVTVTNTGSVDAYIRTLFAFEDTEGADGIAGRLHTNSGMKINYPVQGDDYLQIGDDNGTLYTVGYVVYPAALAAGETSDPSLLQIFWDKTADNAVMEAAGGKYEILVLSQAVQAEGFADADTALNEAFGKITYDADEMVAGWFNSTPISSPDEEWPDNNPPYGTVATEGDVNLTHDTLLQDEPLYRNTTATTPYTINGNGHTITMLASETQTFDWDETNTIPQMANVFSSSNGSKITVNDLTIAGTMQSNMAGHYVTTNQGNFETEMNNVNIVNTKVVSFSAGISPALSIYGKATLNNCNVYGTTLSNLDTDPMWPVYDVAVVNYTNTTINGGKIGSIYTWAKAYLEINKAEVDTIISACRKTNDFQNGGLVIGSGTTVDTIKVTNKNAVITIKDGAVVNTLDFGGLDQTKMTITIEDGAVVNNKIN